MEYFNISDNNGNYLGSSRTEPPVLVTLKDPTDQYAQWNL